MSRLYLVRHGENIANITKEFSYKKVDYSLTDKGIVQAKNIAKYCKKMGFSKIYSSPLKRAIETAEIIASELHEKVEILENFREINVGDLEGRKDISGAWDIHNKIVDEWLNGNYEPYMPNGENAFELAERFINGIKYILSNNVENNKHLIIGHGMNFFVGTMELCKITNRREYYERENRNCSITTIEVAKNDKSIYGKLLEWASIKYLDE
jgi:broad specificity phosphatase PhoE